MTHGWSATVIAASVSAPSTHVPMTIMFVRSRCRRLPGLSDANDGEPRRAEPRSRDGDGEDDGVRVVVQVDFYAVVTPPPAPGVARRVALIAAPTNLPAP